MTEVSQGLGISIARKYGQGQIRHPLKFKIDLYKKRVTFDEAGQSVEDWSYVRTIKCHYMPTRGEEKTVGRVQNPRSYWLWTDDGEIEYSDQLRDLRDRYGNAVENGAFNVIGIKRRGGWSMVHHTQISIQKVLD